MFSPFDLLLYGGFVITAAGEVLLQICSSLVKGLIRRADASHLESLAVGDSFFTVSWVAAVGGKVLMGVGRFHIQVGPSTIFTVVSRNDALSLDHSVVNLMVGWAWLISFTKLFRLSSP